MSSIVLGLCIGYGIALAMGKVDFSLNNISKHLVVQYPVVSIQIRTGLSYLFIHCHWFCLSDYSHRGNRRCYCKFNDFGKLIEGESYLKRVSGGVLADGFNSMLAGIFNSFPNSIFAQNNGIIQLTGVASRYVGYYIAAMLVLLGLFPDRRTYILLMPDPVLGGATLLMFGTVAAAGIRIISSQQINRKATLVLAVSLSLGLGIINAGYPENGSGSYKKYLLIGYHYRWINCHFSKCPDSR